MTEYERPIVTVDVVLLTLKAGVLYTALARRDRSPAEGEWTIPGGWVHTDKDEDALAAARRILASKAGLESPYLEQLETFADKFRDARGWSVSIGYYALVAYERVGGAANPLLQWRAVDEIRSLPFDHLKILHTAVARVRSKTLYSSLALHLMPEVFTLGEAQSVYEQLLGAKLDKRAFRRRIEELEVLQEAAQPRKDTGARVAHRPAQYYRIKPRQALAIADKNLGVK